MAAVTAITALFDLYHTEVFNFLKTATIKFEPFSKLLNEQLQYSFPTLDIDNNNFYYKRLMGEYIPGDVEMYVTSIDTGEKILFSRENLKLHPKTAAIYRVNTTEYELLCKRYESQQDLIKAIVYPVDSISTIENSPDFWLLAADTSILQTNEVVSIVNAVNHFLEVCRKRWWVKEYCFEEGYPVAFYALMWQLLPLILFTRRMCNIRTSSVHQYHIWEYLCSKGLENYRDILTLKQALFLYRNMEYILSNKGTSGNLFVLADNILSDFAISLLSKHIYQQQVDRADECRRTPEIISKQIISYLKSAPANTSSFETMEIINGRMYAKGIERDNSSDYIREIEQRYGECEEDRLPTKLLELKKDTVSSTGEAVLISFVLDTLLYRWTHNLIPYKFRVTDPLTNAEVYIDVGTGLALLYYFTERSLGTIPINVPTDGYVRCPYFIDRPKKEELPTHIWIEHNQYPIQYFVDVDYLLNSIYWSNNPNDCETPEKFVDFIYKQFSAMMNHVHDVRCSADLCYNRSMWALYNHFCDCRVLTDINLVKSKTYTELFESNATLKDIFQSYKEVETLEQYGLFASAIFAAMVPIKDQKFKQYVGFLDSMNELFDKLASLCIQLFSYNVTFISQRREKQSYLFYTPLMYHHLDNWGTSSQVLDRDYGWKILERDSTIAYDTVSHPLDYSKQYDTTLSVDSEMHAITLNTTIDQYGVSYDLNRIQTSIGYHFA